ncbi:MAG: valine--tRNA ligase, partial [Candidatus Bipolaricaulia bacterium]
RLGWAWKEKYGHRIREQLKALGCSCDWERERFTLDEGLSNAVLEVFVRLYEEGYIYRGQRIINWCPRCRTSLSDLEVVHEEAEGRLYYIKYPLEGSQSQSQSQSQEAITIATTRPETMLADTAVAVHPEDERFKDLIGRTAILPLLGRKLPIVADPSVARDFGTGALKVTPAHDLTDFEIAQRHSLEAINIFNEDATTNEEAGPYKGLERFACRKRVLEDLKGEGLLVKEEPYTHSIGHCQRCHTVIEPRLSTQWFVRMEPLARPAIEAVRSGKIAFIPRRWEKIYFDWMENVEDWCISRQLWWGHRIPAWHCQDCQKITVGRAAPSRCAACGSERLEQDEDILDTWFSSALWPFSIMGWPQRTEELKYFYPTSLLVTGPDIIFFWVARMIVMGLHFMGEVPFEVVLFNPIVKDEKGRRMSKSLGTGVDPLELKEQYGMDALRFTLAASMTKGQDLKLSLRDVEGSRKFLNKIWNAARFSLGHLKDFSPPPAEPASLPLEDRWILSRLQGTIAQVRRCLEGYDFNQACSALYAFIWHDLCDWYLEVIKGRLYGEDGGDRSTAQAVLHRVLGDALKLLHPFVPFITEELWQHLPHRPSESVVIAPFPQAEARWRDPQSESEMAMLQELITAVRTL